MTLCPPIAKNYQLITSKNMNSILPSTYRRTPGTKAYLSCLVPSTFQLIGHCILTCQGNGMWDHPIPKCVDKESPLAQKAGCEETRSPRQGMCRSNVIVGEYIQRLLKNNAKFSGSKRRVDWKTPSLTGLQSKSGVWLGENRLSVRPSGVNNLRLAVAFSLVSHKPLMIQKSNLVSLLTLMSSSRLNTKFCDLDIDFALQWTHTDIDFNLFSFTLLITYMPYLVGL